MSHLHLCPIRESTAWISLSFFFSLSDVFFLFVFEEFWWSRQTEFTTTIFCFDISFLLQSRPSRTRPDWVLQTHRQWSSVWLGSTIVRKTQSDTTLVSHRHVTAACRKNPGLGLSSTLALQNQWLTGLSNSCSIGWNHDKNAEITTKTQNHTNSWQKAWYHDKKNWNHDKIIKITCNILKLTVEIMLKSLKSWQECSDEQARRRWSRRFVNQTTKKDIQVQHDVSRQ